MLREVQFFNKFLKPAFAKPMLAAALFIAKINFSSSFLRFFLRIFLNFRKFKNYSKLSVFRFSIFSYIIHAVSRSKTLFYFQFFLMFSCQFPTLNSRFVSDFQHFTSFYSRRFPRLKFRFYFHFSIFSYIIHGDFQSQIMFLFSLAFGKNTFYF